MRLAVFALSWFLLAGCSTTPADRAGWVVSAESWQALVPLIMPAPDALGSALRQEMQSRQSAERVSGATSETVLPRELLGRLLSDSVNRALLPDEEFYRLYETVTGDESRSSARFVEALSDYLLSPETLCEQPVISRYFQQRYADLRQPECQQRVPFFVIERYRGGKIHWLDPERVKEVHLLYAGAAGGLASRFGHVALRLIVCPEETTESQACDSNLYQHIILGFMAHVDEFNLDIVKGMTGAYNAHLYAFPFMDSYRDYAIDEFRELYSLPILLDKPQQNRFIRELSEIHWRYSGEYRFFSQNCATILQHALRRLLTGLQSDKQMSDVYLRPDNFFKAAKKSPWFKFAKLASLEQAEREGFYFSSTKEFYDQALRLVAGAMTEPLFSDTTGYLEIPAGERMAGIAHDTQYLMRLKQQPRLLQAQILLEELAFVRAERRLFAEGSRYFSQFNESKIAAVQSSLSLEQKQLFNHCLLNPLQQVSAPVIVYSGIPYQADIPLPEPGKKCRQPENRKKLTQLIPLINVEQEDKTQWQRVLLASLLLNATIENISELKQLHVVRRL